MILVVDNYDSFTWNLVHYLMELGAEVRVERNDALTAADALATTGGGATGFCGIGGGATRFGGNSDFPCFDRFWAYVASTARSRCSGGRDGCVLPGACTPAARRLQMRSDAHDFTACRAVVTRAVLSGFIDSSNNRW